jgi:class 3 adenylate cyclase/tetratricopeptide (TPR) repeat protein
MGYSALAKFCSECGAGLRDSPPLAPQAVNADGNLRYLVVVYCDLVNSTAMATSLDHELWQQMLMDYQAAISAAVARFGGHVARVIGDGVVVYFGWPKAHENDGERAIQAGIGILREIEKLNRLAPHNSRPKLQVRIAVHAGMTLIDTSGEAFGETIHIAARAQAAAEVDSVTVTDSLHDIVSKRFVVKDIRSHEFKGIPRPIRLFRIASATHDLAKRSEASAQTTPLIGRDRELRDLLALWSRALDGEGQVVTISGEAGIGKSRIVEEFRRHLVQPNLRWLEATGVQSFENSVLYPIAEMFKGVAGLSDDESPSKQVERIKGALSHADLDGNDALYLIAELLGLAIDDTLSPPLLTADQKRTRLLAILADWIIGITRDRPTVFVVEDVHWTDPSTQELIDLLMERVASQQLLLVVTERTIGPPWRSRSPSGTTQIVLDRLSDESIRLIIANLTKSRTIAASVSDAIVDRSDGVPIFVEELTRFATEQDGWDVLRDIPTTLAATFAARLAHLGSAQHAAHLCAVVGATAQYSLLRSVSSLPVEDLKAALDRLVDSQILVAEGVPPQATYHFKHALLRDAAYDTLLSSHRRGLHRRLAQCLQRQFPDIFERSPETMARHWAAAREPRLAVSAWASAGRLAARRRAFKEARDAYQQALAALMILPDSVERDDKELAIRYKLFGVQQVTQGYSAHDVAENTNRARALTKKGGDVVKQINLATGSWAALSSAGDYTAAARLAAEIADLAVGDGAPESLALAHMVQLTARSRIGDLVGAERHFLTGQQYFTVPAFRRKTGAIAQTYGNASKVSGLLGRVAASEERCAYALAVAKENENPYDLAFANHMAATSALSLRSFECAREYGEQAVRLSDEHRFPQFAAIARVALGRALAELEGPPAGIEMIRQGIEGMTRNGARAALTMYLTWLAEAHDLNGAVDDALGVIEQALSVNPEERIYQAEALRIRGGLRFKCGDFESGEADVRGALRMSADMKALRFQIRAAGSLAQILADRQKIDDARNVLTAICMEPTLESQDRDVLDVRRQLVALVR